MEMNMVDSSGLVLVVMGGTGRDGGSRRCSCCCSSRRCLSDDSGRREVGGCSTSWKDRPSNTRPYRPAAALIVIVDRRLSLSTIS